ncbi:iron ABC transporter permease [Corynebacterium mastitidis]|uniref:Iron ABC transporter permease n=1 Tax=Corynebacterium mastitidis TaxID=161890 RepID=A0A2N0X9C2_9CORY|nr:iron ABC transporter permease [Corynebacterium mastitidis]MCH6197178.1 iron ABC transporter permease [Corynebacterium mastitidis]PKF69303.1 iron ABC transporter permease [Corynebacterium mastitidis]
MTYPLAGRRRAAAGPARPRAVVLALAAPLLVCALILLSLLTGSRALSPAEVWEAIPGGWRYAVSGVKATDVEMVLGIQRIPRTALALLAGLALGAAGALMQGFTRNPLADPGFLGVGAGAAAAVAVGLSLGWLTPESAYVWPSMLGAVLVTALLFLLSSSGPTAGSPLAFVLAGTALSALLMAVVNALVITNERVLDALRTWATGSVAGRDFSVIAVVAPVAAVALLAALLLGPSVNLLSLGEESAHALGVSVRRAQGIGVVVISALVAAAVAAAGPVSFIGLAAPHMVRAFTGPDYRLVIPLSALVGGVLALGADVLGRVLAAPGELPMGIVLALLGVPVFVWLVRRGRVGGAL